MLKDRTQWRRWGSNPQPLGIEPSTLPLSHCTPHRPNVIKLCSCSTQLSTKFIMLINVKMPTIIVLLTFISMINTKSESLKDRIIKFLSILFLMSSWTFIFSSAWKKSFFNLSSRAGINKTLVRMANREDPDKIASSGATWSASALLVWSWIALFVYAFLVQATGF